MVVDIHHGNNVCAVLCLVCWLGLCRSFPTGAPLSACSHLMPVHMDGELQTVVSPYLLVLNETKYGNSPIKLTVTTMGPNIQNYMAFMLQARSEYGEPAGRFSGVPSASRSMTCYSGNDTLTHTAAFIRPAMEVTWHPPPKNIGKITIQGSISLNKIKFWPVKSEPLTGTGVLDLTGTRRNRPGNKAGTTGGGQSVSATKTTQLLSLAVLMFSVHHIVK